MALESRSMSIEPMATLESPKAEEALQIGFPQCAVTIQAKTH